MYILYTKIEHSPPNIQLYQYPILFNIFINLSPLTYFPLDNTHA